jgi:hypothetical protein
MRGIVRGCMAEIDLSRSSNKRKESVGKLHTILRMGKEGNIVKEAVSNGWDVRNR